MVYSSLGCFFVILISMMTPLPRKKGKHKKRIHETHSIVVETTDSVEEMTPQRVASLPSSREDRPPMIPYLSSEMQPETGLSSTTRRRRKTSKLALERLNSTSGKTITIEINPYSERPPPSPTSAEEISVPTSSTQSSMEMQSEAGPSSSVRRHGKTSGAIEKSNATLGKRITIEIDSYNGRPTLSPRSGEESSPPISRTQLSSEIQSEAGPSSTVRRRGRTRGLALEKLNATSGKKITIEIDPYSGRPTDRVQAKHFQTLIGIAAREDVPMQPDFRLNKTEHLRAAYDRIKSHADVKGIDINPWICDAINRRLSKQQKDSRYHLKKLFEKKGDAARPKWMPDEEWERHKNWWNNPKYIEKCKKNQKTRLNCVKKLHSSGSTSFAVRRKEIEKELGGAPCGPILLYYRSHYREYKHGKGRWSSDSAEAAYRKMVDMREKATTAGTPMNEDEIVDTVLGNGGRRDWRNGWEYGHIPKCNGGRRSSVSHVDFEAALRASQAAMREEIQQELEQKIKVEMDAKIESINLSWQQKMQQQQEAQQMMQMQLQQMNNLIIMNFYKQLSSSPQLDTSPMPSISRKDKRKAVIEAFSEDGSDEEEEDDSNEEEYDTEEETEDDE